MNASILQKQEGAALVMAMLIMVILSLLGVAAVQLSTTESKISKNYKDGVQALYAAEAGLEAVFDSFMQGDTDGDGDVDSSDTVNAGNDLDGSDGTGANPGTGTADFTQVFVDKADIGSASGTITMNAGTNIQSYVWVDVNNATAEVTIYSMGNPSGTNSRKTVAMALKATAENLINGAINNAINCVNPCP